MKNFICAIVALLAFGTAGNAADTYSSIKDIPVSVASSSNPFSGFYAGVQLGGQKTTIDIDYGNTDILRGLSADGFTYGGFGGFNWAPGNGRFVAGPYIEGSWSDVSLELFGEDILQQKGYVQPGVRVGIVSGKTLWSAHLAYEWQNWEAGGAFGLDTVDVEVEGWVVGLGVDTKVSEQFAIGLKFDYFMLTEAEAPGGVDLSDFLDESDAFRVSLRGSWYPNVGLPALN